jgi:DUF971 family protein
VSEIWPVEIKIRNAGGSLFIAFDNAAAGEISAELLRVESPSAEVKGHGPGQEQLVWGKKQVRITRAEPVGNYAVRLIFNDGHSTGIFTWTYLHKLMVEGSAIFSSYEKKLAAAHLGRD